jgi:hypothetical protein
LGGLVKTVALFNAGGIAAEELAARGLAAAAPNADTPCLPRLVLLPFGDKTEPVEPFEVYTGATPPLLQWQRTRSQLRL